MNSKHKNSYIFYSYLFKDLYLISNKSGFDFKPYFKSKVFDIFHMNYESKSQIRKCNKFLNN